MLKFQLPNIKVSPTYTEAHEYDVSVWVAEWTQSVVIFLSCCVPQGEFYLSTINLVGWSA